MYPWESPSPYNLRLDPEWVGLGGVITGRVNCMTGEVEDVPFWVNQIDREDWDWFQRWWDKWDEWDYIFNYDMKWGTFNGQPIPSPERASCDCCTGDCRASAPQLPPA